MYDILDAKLQIFYDCCGRIGLSENLLPTAFQIMLKGQAADYYYSRLSNRGFNFANLITSIRNHFETEEKRQLYMSEWRETTLLRIILDNLDKTRLECLEILFDKLHKIQRDLQTAYQTEYSLRN